MAIQKYKFALNQRSLSEDRRRSASPQSSDIQLNAGDNSFATASIRLIKKNLVKEQTKQFEQKSEASPKGGSANRTAASLGKTNIQKSKSSLFLNQDRDQVKQCSFEDTDLVPTSVTSIPSFPSGRNCQSVLVGQRVSLFDNTGKNNENVATKPSIQPKPERLSVKRPAIKGDDGKSVTTGAGESSISPLPPSFAEFLSPTAKGQRLNTNKVYLSGSPISKTPILKSSSKVEDSPKSDSATYSPSGSESVNKKELHSGVGKYLNSPDVGRILANDASDGGKSADEGKTPVSKIKCNDGNNYKPTEKIGESSATMANNSNANIPAKVTNCLNKSPMKPEGISPPPKPPRVLLELNQSPLTKPSNEKLALEVKPSPQTKPVAKGGTYERLTEAISVVKVSEGLAISNETSLKSSLSPSIDKSTPVKTELSNSLKKSPVDRRKMDQWWESKFIRALPTATPRKKENFKTKRINNPTYMYAKVGLPDDVISGRGLVRHHSDELLDVSPLHNKRMGSLKMRYNDGPIYHDPNDVVQERRKLVENVTFDRDGYAMPRVIKDADIKSNDSDGCARNEVVPSAAIKQDERSYVKSKVSNAYAILRLPMFPGGQGGSAGRDEDVEPEVDLEEHRKLLRHVSNVKYTTNESVAKYERVRLALTNRLFQYAMIIGIQRDASGRLQPKILFCFPNEMIDKEVLTSSFCFPDADSLQPHSYHKGEMFSFILTSSTGDRRYGLCRRYLPPGFGMRLPEALCVVSLIGDPGFYGDLLTAAENSRSLSMECAEELLQLAYSKPFPAPNHEIYLHTVGPNNKKRALILKRSPDSRLHTVEFTLLLRSLSVSSLIKVFGAVLLERKVIFYARSLSTLSSCICALVALLYPFEWQHTFVTILPSTLIDIVDAPTPYIIGLLSSAVSGFSQIINELNEVLVVDLDSGSLLHGCGDESRILPKKLQKALTAALSDDSDIQNLAPGQKGRGVQNATIAEAFLRMFVETCSHYTEYICSQQDGEIVFQRELFVKAVQSRSIRLFLDWFTQTQMFAVFITGRLKDNMERGYFEQQILEYRQEMEETTSALGNMKAVGKKIADFFRGSGDKIKKTFQKVVYV